MLGRVSKVAKRAPALCEALEGKLPGFVRTHVVNPAREARAETVRKLHTSFEEGVARHMEEVAFGRAKTEDATFSGIGKAAVDLAVESSRNYVTSLVSNAGKVALAGSAIGLAISMAEENLEEPYKDMLKHLADPETAVTGTIGVTAASLVSHATSLASKGKLASKKKEAGIPTTETTIGKESLERIANHTAASEQTITRMAALTTGVLPEVTQKTHELKSSREYSALEGAATSAHDKMTAKMVAKSLLGKTVDKVSGKLKLYTLDNPVFKEAYRTGFAAGQAAHRFTKSPSKTVDQISSTLFDKVSKIGTQPSATPKSIAAKEGLERS
ncbi:MAG: hypothetical protein RLN62_02365 [Rickettsiales bacterium]